MNMNTGTKPRQSLAMEVLYLFSPLFDLRLDSRVGEGEGGTESGYREHTHTRTHTVGSCMPGDRIIDHHNQPPPPPCILAGGSFMSVSSEIYISPLPDVNPSVPYVFFSLSFSLIIQMYYSPVRGVAEG